jgi:hypothetical protein
MVKKMGARADQGKTFASDILVLNALTTMGICNLKVETSICRLLSFLTRLSTWLSI